MKISIVLSMAAASAALTGCSQTEPSDVSQPTVETIAQGMGEVLADPVSAEALADQPFTPGVAQAVRLQMVVGGVETIESELIVRSHPEADVRLHFTDEAMREIEATAGADWIERLEGTRLDVFGFAVRSSGNVVVSVASEGQVLAGVTGLPETSLREFAEQRP